MAFAFTVRVAALQHGLAEILGRGMVDPNVFKYCRLIPRSTCTLPLALVLSVLQRPLFLPGTAHAHLWRPESPASVLIIGVPLERQSHAYLMNGQDVLVDFLRTQKTLSVASLCALVLRLKL